MLDRTEADRCLYESLRNLRVVAMALQRPAYVLEKKTSCLEFVCARLRVEREALNKPVLPKKKERQPKTKNSKMERWRAVNWDLKDEELASYLGCTLVTVRKNRLHFAPHTRSRTRVGARMDWYKVDWAMTNEAICNLFGCAYHTCRRMRKKLG